MNQTDARLAREDNAPRRAGLLPADSTGVAQLARHFDLRAERYFEKYNRPFPRNLYEHEKRVRADFARTWIREYELCCRFGKLLDVGCGDGRTVCQTLVEQRSWQATGIDVSAQMARRASELARSLGVSRRVRWHVGTVKQCPELFDVVTALGVVGYQEDQLEFLSDLSSRVAPNGLLIFTFANAFSVPRQVRAAFQRLRRWRRGETSAVRFRALRPNALHGHLVSTGFQLQEIRWLCFGLGLSGGWGEIQLSRWCERHWPQAAMARYIAQVGVVCFRRS